MGPAPGCTEGGHSTMAERAEFAHDQPAMGPWWGCQPHRGLLAHPQYSPGLGVRTRHARLVREGRWLALAGDNQQAFGSFQKGHRGGGLQGLPWPLAGHRMSAMLS